MPIFFFNALNVFKKLNKFLKIYITFNIEFCSCLSRTSSKLVFCSVTKVRIANGETVGELLASSLASVSGANFHPILEPFVSNVLIVDIDLKSNSVPLLSVEILKHGSDKNG